MDRRIDLAIALVVAALGTMVLFAARDIQLGMINDPVGPRGFPTYLGVIFLVGGFALAVRRLLTWKTSERLVANEGKEDDEPHRSASAGRAMVVVGLAAIYTLSLPALGYVVATLLFLAVLLRVMGVTAWRRLIGVTVGYTLVTFVVFAMVLSVRLPGGVLAGVHRSLGIAS